MEIKKEPEEVFFDLSIVKEEYQLQEPPINEEVFETIPEDTKLTAELIDAKVEEFEREWKKAKRKERWRKFSIKCFICDRIIANRGSYWIHMRVHKNNIGKGPDYWKKKRDVAKSKLEVPIEPPTETDVKIAEFERAWKEDKRKLKYKSKCKICNKLLLSEGILRRHMRSHNGAEFKCPQCYKVYKREESLQNHIDSHGTEDSQKYDFLRQLLDKRLENKKYLKFDM